VKLLDIGVYPKTLWAINTNNAFIQINYNPETRRATFTCAIDNLIKGAAGQAVENMDLIIASRL
jgi:N-acetyl-gamma-glutamyl-phosphate reductase